MNFENSLAKIPKNTKKYVQLHLALILIIALQPLLGAPPLRAEDDEPVGPAATSSVIINEIHYDPSPASSWNEFIELYNGGAAPVDLSGWALAGGVDYEFPSGSVIAPGGYLVVAINPSFLERSYGVRALGPFRGRLSNDGDRVILRDARAQEIDRVEYGVGFPWPIVGYGVERSIGLLNPSADNALGAAWRAMAPTPGRANQGVVDNLPPLLLSVEHTPQAPTARDAVSIRARVVDGDGVRRVTLWVQVVPPGGYIRITDPEYATQWTAYEMQKSGDDLYTFALPASIVRHRHLIRYRIEAVDNGGRSVTAPFPDDPQPNFALFVNDGPVLWYAAVNPHQGDPKQVYRFNRMRPLPIYHLIANPADVADAQFIPPSTRASGYMGTEYLWRGTFVYDGVVYDHIGFRARGQVYRYATGKNKWKFNFLPGHRLVAKDNFGNPYPVSWDKLNLSSGMQHANRGYRGEHGVFESLALRIFSMMGVPAPASHFVHFRVIDGVNEITANQYEGDFWGLYLAVEEIDRRFLRARDLPDGNLYKMKDGFGDLDNHGLDQPADGSDLAAFMQAYSQPQGESWWRSHFNLENYYRFRAALEAVRHYDVDEGKNYYYFRNPQDGRWSIWPWDTDLTWADRFFGRGNEPFRDRVLPFAEFNKEYQNALRELRDLLFNPEQIDLLIDEAAALIDTPADGPSMVDADRALWDYNPILVSRYVIDERARWGEFYKYSPTGDFRGMMAYMKSWARSRMAWIDQTLLTDRGAPAKPSVAYTGPAGYPADALTFTASAFADPQGDAFAGVQWRAAQVVWPGLPGYSADAPNRYEIDGGWTSPVMTQLAPFRVPQGVCMPGFACRVRVRMMDSTGRWSHWSEPLHFVVGPPATPPTRDLKITEIMYNPPAWGAVPGTELEFIEFKNTGNTTLDLSNVQVANGIEYRFPVGFKLAPGEFVVLAENPARFAARYNLEAHGKYSGQLSNSGETIEVNDAFGRAILQVTYSDRNGWPVEADGAGKSLVPIDPNAGGDPNQPSSWRASTAEGGSPGADDPAPIALNEFIFDPTSKALRAIELYNPMPYSVDLSGWVLTDRWTSALAYGASVGDVSRIPAGVAIAPGGYRTVALTQLTRPLQFGAGPGEVTLAAVMRGNRFAGYAQRVQVYAPWHADSLGRTILQDGSAAFTPQASSPDAANNAPLSAPVVISKVRLLGEASSPVQWIELTNRTDEAIALYAPAHASATWLLPEVNFWLPPATTLAPRGRLLLVAGSPAAVCGAGTAPAGWRVSGPLPTGVPTGGGTLRLLAPAVNASIGQTLYLLVDEVRYDGIERLQATSGAAYWERISDDAPGVDRSNWRASGAALTPTGGADDGPIGLCSFDAYRVEGGQVRVEWTARNLQPGWRLALWRSPTFDRSAAERVNGEIQSAVQIASSLHWLIDDAAPSEGPLYYWLQVITPDGEIDVAATGLRTRSSLVYLPVISQTR